MRSGFVSEDFESELASLVRKRSAGLTDAEDEIRRSARDMLRNGRYKPTGRGKPASEYLIRSAMDPATFPRINWPVDVCNYISLLSLLPISIWDLRKSNGNRYIFRLGREGEEYVFNSAGQVISLTDLVVGCEVDPQTAEGWPIVNPVKDSMKTKTTRETESVAAVIYAPGDYPVTRLDEVCALFAELLQKSAPASAAAVRRLVEPGEEVRI